MTVSRVINGENNVRDKTRKVVEDAIHELGYSPNEAARSLAGARQIVVAMLYSKPSAYIGEFLFGGLEQARKSNTQIVVEKCPTEDDARATVKRLITSGIDGVILPPPLGDSARLLDELESAEIPTVVVSSGRIRDRVSAVTVDDFRAAQTMTEHIIGLGHQRIGFIIGDPHQQASNFRLAGFRHAMQEAGLDCPDELLAQGQFTYRSGLDATEQLLDLDDQPTAIFASNDLMAAASVAIAHRRGLDVPGDLTVCGYDDIAMAVMIWPELTTIRQPISDLSRAAADLLIKQIRAGSGGEKVESQHLLLDFKLIKRQSDAKPCDRSHKIDANNNN